MVVRGAACRCGAGTLGQPGQPGQPGGDKGGGPGGNMARGYCPPASHLTFPLLPDPPARLTRPLLASPGRSAGLTGQAGRTRAKTGWWGQSRHPLPHIKEYRLPTNG